MPEVSFGRRVVEWQLQHGRHDLPWQRSRDPYCVWLSEIMLQQTQVSTVIPYYERFIARFPDIDALASASLDDVLARWSGLGYYSRARNLHRAASIVHERHAGVFPARFDEVAALPGIGRSTAGAIMAIAYGARFAILDGNVKRVLARAFGISGYPGDKLVADALWRVAEDVLPHEDLQAYTQGLMDLGATICVRSRPLCALCPLRDECIALREHRVHEIPAPRPRAALPHRRTVMLILEHGGRVLLEKRPAPGIWGGLWCFPEVPEDADVSVHCTQRFGASIAEAGRLADVQHGFTHFTLTISPQRLRVSQLTPAAEEGDRRWLDIEAAKSAAIPAPVRRILEGLAV